MSRMTLSFRTWGLKYKKTFICRSCKNCHTYKTEQHLPASVFQVTVTISTLIRNKFIISCHVVTLNTAHVSAFQSSFHACTCTTLHCMLGAFGQAIKEYNRLCPCVPIVQKPLVSCMYGLAICSEVLLFLVY